MDRHMQPSIIGPEVWNHMWFDRKCQLHGCQSLVHKRKIDEIKAVLDNADISNYHTVNEINRIVNG